MSAVAVHHVVEGPADAPVVVLSPSLGATHATWERQAAALRDAFRVVRYDPRGHGASPVPSGPYSLADLGADLLALLDALGVERAHLCGLSLGGMTSMWVAEHAPERVDRLVLCCTSAALGPPDMWAQRAATVRAEGTGAVAASVVGRWFTPAWRAEHPDEVARFEAMVAATPAEGYAGGCAAIETMDIAGGLPAIAAPTLVVSGAQDPTTPREHGRAIAAAVPTARFELLDPAAHLSAWERPDAISALIRGHLERSADELHAAGRSRCPLEARDADLHAAGRSRRPLEGRDADLGAAGMRVRREVLGDAHVDRAQARATPFSQPYQDYIARSAWGEIWTRPGLDRRTRSAITLAALTALRAEDELAMHVRAAIANGLTPAEIAEILLHTAVYAGVPQANTAFAVAQRTLAEMGAIDPPDEP